ncbi:MAG: hypothetical protein J6V25_06290 [Oscillospiraceae bacterium]|nr:hypothetical protein [Oscillospiraceae bacterium]
MHMDAFSQRHPLVNLVFFIGAIGCGMLIQHPAYLIASILCASSYYLLLQRRKAVKLLAAMVPLVIVMTLLNPLFNTYGETVLWYVFGRPYTWEAIIYGAVMASILVGMLIWFGCYNQVLTSDKFTCLFGNVIPAISLLLVMVLRMIPNLMRKARQLLDARKSLGKGSVETASTKEKVADGMMILSALTDWALEGSIVTGDSMRSRGYGSARRTSFMIYRMTGEDFVLLGLQLALLALVAVTAAAGGVQAEFTPKLIITQLTGAYLPGFAAYCCFMLIPTVLYLKEALRWYISRSRI